MLHAKIPVEIKASAHHSFRVKSIKYTLFGFISCVKKKNDVNNKCCENGKLFLHKPTHQYVVALGLYCLKYSLKYLSPSLSACVCQCVWESVWWEDLHDLQEPSSSRSFTTINSNLFRMQTGLSCSAPYNIHRARPRLLSISPLLLEDGIYSVAPHDTVLMVLGISGRFLIRCKTAAL